MLNLPQPGGRERCAVAEQANYLKNLKTESVVQQVINCLTDGMVSGQLKPGDKLPSEPELAAQLGVARTSVREATKILTYLGVLVSRRSEGTFVAGGFQESMIDPMVYGIILQGQDFDSLMELRELIEVGIMRLAVKKKTPEGMAKVRSALEEFEDAACGKLGGDIVDCAFRADDAFHDAVSALCKNELADKINRVVRTLTYAVRRKTVETMIKTGRSREHIDVHWKLYGILESGNLDGLEKFVHSTYFLDVVK